LPADFVLLYNWGIAVCAVMAVVWLFRLRKRGVSAMPMLLAFASFGAMLFALRDQAPMWVVIANGIALFLLLVTDAVLRVANKKEGE